MLFFLRVNYIKLKDFLEMNLLKKVLEKEVFLALGCTEPIAVAYACSIASFYLNSPWERLEIVLDSGVYKNGFSVHIPNTNGEKGNLLAGVLGALIAKPELKMEILKEVEPDKLKKAKEIVDSQKAKLILDHSKKNLYIEVRIFSSAEYVRVVVQHSHTNLELVEKNKEIIFSAQNSKETEKEKDDYKKQLQTKHISDFIELVEAIDKEDYQYILKGVFTNLKIAEEGLKLKKVGYYLQRLEDKGFISKNIFSQVKILTAAATDARMAGVNLPVMASGGSGNQGIVAILVPYLVGKEFGIKEETIIKSIGFSHLLNSYVKAFTGSLSSLCGCAIAAGVGAAAAIVYQQQKDNLTNISLAINNIISDIGGMLCDGAKGGCALKVATSADSALRAAYMALNGYGIGYEDGFMGKSGEETIQNLSKIIALGMPKANDVMLDIMTYKV
ncbi:MAG: hypothetical protein PWR24_2052 [Desulfonauticus sp.]|nr:MAG: hypothetical protein XD41_0936 [Desulfonauticus sp. 38_4375]MDK2922495.1 hypothetical protein [Desulfonauticus sp.]